MLELDKDFLSDSFIAVERSNRLFMPVCALAEALSLAINCTEDRAYGFVLQESRPLVISLKEGYTISGRSAFPINDAAFMRGAELFVDTVELSKWLPIDFDYKQETSTVQMHARELLPLQGFRKRQKFKRPPPPIVPKHFDDFTPSRGVASVPTIDLTSQVQLSGDGRGATKGSTLNSVSLSGDLLYMSGEAHLQAEKEDLKRLDFSLFRRSDAGFRVGPVSITQLVVGTSQVSTVDGIGAPTTPMYGLLLSNRPLSGASKFLSHNIDGYLPAGWDAELFHNGIPIGYQPPTQDGRYHFEDLRVQYGINSFKVLLHGPFGETRESEQTFFSDATTPTGAFLYTISAAWQTGLTPSDQIGPERESNVTVTTDFGVSQGLAGSVLLVRQTDSHGKEQDYAGAGMRTAVGYTLLSLDLINSFSPTDGREGQLLTARSSTRDVFGGALQAEQRFFRDFDSTRFPRTTDPLLSQTLIRLSSSVSGWNNILLPLSLELGLETRRSGEADWTSVWRGAGGWNGWNGALQADVSYLQKVLNAVGMFQISTKVKGASVRGQIGLTMAPTLTPSVINVNADKDLGSGFQLNSGFIHNPASNTSELLIGVSKRFGLVGYAISATGSTTGAYTVNVGLSTSVANDRFNRQAIISDQPLSPSGMVAVSAITAALGDTPGQEVPGVGFVVNGSRASTISGSKGLPVIAFLPPDIAVDVSVDIATVEDPFMVPREEGCHITPRAGVVSACRFTMVTGGEIDGMVLARLNPSEEVPLRGVRVDLMAVGAPGPKLIASTWSEESGYYLFKAVKPGSYRIIIPNAEVARLKIAAASPIAATMPEGGDQITGKDFVLQAVTGATGAPPRGLAPKVPVPLSPQGTGSKGACPPSGMSPFREHSGLED